MGRKQKVVLNNHKSEWSDVLSGVPQGSVSGPTLFNIHVSDMPLIVNSSVVQFADDDKMFRTIKLIDFHQLQQDINVLSEWAKKWQLYFNISKVNVTGYNWDNHINLVNIQLTALLSHLAMLLKIWEYKYSQLKFHDHTTAITKKTNRLLATIQKPSNISTKTQLLTSINLIFGLCWNMVILSGDLSISLISKIYRKCREEQPS